MDTINFSTTRQKLASVMDKVAEDRAPILITRQKGSPAVIMSLDEYNALQETAYLMSNPANAKRLFESVAELKAGGGVVKELNLDDLYWQDKNKETVKRINKLLKDINGTPFAGIGKPEALRHNLSGYWSRRIDTEHRLVYTIEDNGTIVVIQCRYHYQ